MKRFIPCALVLAAAVAHAEVMAKLAVEPATVQAGIPASIVLTITNDGAAPAKLPPFIALRAEKEDGTSFDVTEGTKRTRPMPNAPVTLAPHASTTVRWDPDGGWTMPWFGDARLTAPGTYRIVAHLVEKADSDARSGPASTSATLTVTAPQGDDVAVCKAAREKATRAPADSCPVRALLLDAADRAFWSQHLGSTYAKFFAGAYPAPLPDQIAALEAHLKNAGSDPIADWRRIYLARLEHDAAADANAKHDAAGAKTHAARALALYRSVAAQGRLADARKRANVLADDLDKQMTALHWR